MIARGPDGPISATTQIGAPLPFAGAGSGGWSLAWAPSASSSISRARSALAIAAASAPSSSSPRRVQGTSSMSATQVGEPSAPTSALDRPTSARVERQDRLVGCGLALGLGREALLVQVLRRRDQGRQRALHVLEALVGLALGVERARGEIETQPAHGGRLRQVEQLRHLRADLAGLGIDARAAEQNEIGACSRRSDGGERARRRERVGAGERRIAQVHRRGPRRAPGSTSAPRAPTAVPS